MKARHRAREAAFQFLYQQDVAKAAELAQKRIPRNLDAPAMARLIQEHFEHFKVPEVAREFAASLAAGALSQIQEIDRLLEKHAAHWKVSRMGFVDRNLLRLAAFELLTHQDIPPSVTIDEAIELAKQFGTTETPVFINGILDALAKECRPKGDVPPSAASEN